MDFCLATKIQPSEAKRLTNLERLEALKLLEEASKSKRR